MTRDQFGMLKIGDLCFVNRGHDAERICRVVYKSVEDDVILIRSVDGQKFKSQNNSGRNHRLINWRELSTLEKEG
jgi:hypothetical protein